MVILHGRKNLLQMASKSGTRRLKTVKYGSKMYKDSFLDKNCNLQ